MYNSPATPTGTGRNPPSNTYRSVQSRGAPIGSTSGTTEPAPIMRCVENTVVSVGPYPFVITSSGHTARIRRTASAATTSPPVRTSTTPRKHPGYSSATNENKPDVNNPPVIPYSTTKPAISPASSRPAGATTNRPPCNNGIHHSNVDASQACREWNNTRS